MSRKVTRFGGLMIGALGAVMGLLEGCSSDASQMPEDTLQAQQADEAAAVAALPVAKGGDPCVDTACDPSITVSREPSLVVLRASGHAGLLDGVFNMNAVLNQLLTQA